MRCFFSAITSVLLIGGAVSVLAKAAAVSKASLGKYEQKVEPVLVRVCEDCHGMKKQKGSYTINSFMQDPNGSYYAPNTADEKDQRKDRSGKVVTDDPSTGGPGGTFAVGGSYEMKLKKLLAVYEGLRLKAYPDAVHKWEVPTIGIGATNYPPGFRLTGKVKKGDTITKEEAYWIKQQHIKSHRQRLFKEIAAGEYSKLPDGVKAALESKVFNYGSLGSTLTGLVKDAVESGNYSQVSAYFRNKLALHNGGINDWRRNDEAGLISHGKSKRAKINFGSAATSLDNLSVATEPMRIEGNEGQTPSQSKGTKAGSVSVSNYGFAMRPAIPGLTSRDWHMGQDVSASPTNSQLIAFNPGIIQDVNWHSGYGNYINWKDTKTGLYNFYAHMQQSARGNFRAGQSVAAGTVLGLQGTTGTSTGPHLHWEVSTTPGGGGREKMPIRGRGPNRKDAVGRLAPLSKYDKKAPFGFALGGFTKSGAHEAILGERGREFVIDRDSTQALEVNFPGFLDAINRADGKAAIQVLKNYASYENRFATSASQIVPIAVPVPVPGKSSNSIIPISGGSAGSATDVLAGMG